MFFFNRRTFASTRAFDVLATFRSSTINVSNCSATKVCFLCVFLMTKFMEMFFAEKKSKDKDDAKEKSTKRKADGGKCPFQKSEKLSDFRDQILVRSMYLRRRYGSSKVVRHFFTEFVLILKAEVKDIEQLVTLAKETQACPYYGTRFAIADAEARDVYMIYMTFS